MIAGNPGPAGLQCSRPSIPGWRWEALAEVTAVVIGLGAVGSPLCEGLLSLGVARFVLVDPKRYRPESLSQCEPEEIGEHKVRAVARRLRRRGARVAAFPIAVEDLEPGWVGPQGLIIVCGDRKPVQRAANRLALLCRRQLWKVNLEPGCLFASIRCFDLSLVPVLVCLECVWSTLDYVSERIASCEGSGPPGERRTGSPRALSAFTAGWAALAIASTVAGPERGRLRSGEELVFSAAGPTLIRSTIAPNPDCLAPHQSGGRRLWLPETPDRVTFRDLAERAGFGACRELLVSGSGQLARRVRCERCGTEAETLVWVRHSGRPAGRCACGERLSAIPFFAASSWGRDELGPAWDRPLASLGVRRKAAVTLTGPGDEATLFLG